MRTLTFDEVVELVRAERARQDIKFGPIEKRWQSVPGYQLITRKELEESENGWCKAREGKSAALPEMVQVAACAFAALETWGAIGNGDADEPDPSVCLDCLKAKNTCACAGPDCTDCLMNVKHCICPERPR